MVPESEYLLKFFTLGASIALPWSQPFLAHSILSINICQMNQWPNGPCHNSLPASNMSGWPPWESQLYRRPQKGKKRGWVIVLSPLLLWVRSQWSLPGKVGGKVGEAGIERQWDAAENVMELDSWVLGPESDKLQSISCVTLRTSLKLSRP